MVGVRIFVALFFLNIPVSVSSTEVLPDVVKHAVSDARWNTDHDFTADIVKARKLLASHHAGFTAENGRLKSFRVLLALKRAGDGIELVSMSRDGENRRGFVIDWNRVNGINTPLVVTRPDGYVLLAIRRVMPNGSSFREVVYTPFTDDIDTPRMRELGMMYIRSTLDKAFGELRRSEVLSKSSSGRLVSDVVPSDVALVLSIIEHIDPARLRDERIEWLMNEVLATIAANRGDTYRYSRSTANARGLFQFIPLTYSHIVRQYPKAHLERDFVSGMNDHVNAAKASLLLFDHDLYQLPETQRRFLLQAENKRLLAEYLAASYNGGASRAKWAYSNGGDWHSRLFPETQLYLVKLRLVSRMLHSGE